MALGLPEPGACLSQLEAEAEAEGEGEKCCWWVKGWCQACCWLRSRELWLLALIEATAGCCSLPAGNKDCCCCCCLSTRGAEADAGRDADVDAEAAADETVAGAPAAAAPSTLAMAASMAALSSCVKLSKERLCTLNSPPALRSVEGAELRAGAGAGAAEDTGVATPVAAAPATADWPMYLVLPVSNESMLVTKIGLSEEEWGPVPAIPPPATELGAAAA